MQKLSTTANNYLFVFDICSNAVYYVYYVYVCCVFSFMFLSLFFHLPLFVLIVVA